MKKIIPFNNILTFNTDVKEVTAISLEHKIETDKDSISGTFYISGEYKITDGQLEKEKFNFELPFDIALGSNYNLDTLVVDIDDFRYELIDNNKLKVNIDLYIDGKIIKDTIVEEDNEPLFSEKELRELKDAEEETEEKEISEPILTKIQERLDLLDEMIANVKKEESKKVIETPEEEQNNTDIKIENNNSNETETIFNGLNEEEKYVTYRVYNMLDNDTLDRIMEKYNITKEELSKYNKLEDLHPGIKIIIPTIEKNNDK